MERNKSIDVENVTFAEKEISELKFEKIRTEILISLENEDKELSIICQNLKDFREEKIINVLSYLLENNTIIKKGNKFSKQR